MISSKNNQKIKNLVLLAEKKGRQNQGAFLIEGEKFVLDAIASSILVKEIFVSESKFSKYSTLLNSVMCDITLVSDNVFAHISETKTNQGIIAVAALPKFPDFVPTGKFLVLDRIQDPGNMGTIIRSAVATSFEKIVCIDCADVFSPKVVRSSAGSIFHACFYFFSENELIEKLGPTKLFIASAEGKNIFQLNNDFPSTFGLVIGNEGNGVSKKLKKFGELISLPMENNIESLNAAVCASIVMFLISFSKNQ